MIKSAVILCGGYGTRLLPITKKIPKPMVMVDGKPFLYYLIKQCKLNGINEIILLCGYKSEKIKKYFKNGKKFGLSIKYSFNPPDINTYKRLVDAKQLLKKNFLLLYSDNYSSLNLNDLYSVYNKFKSNFLISISSKNRGNINISKKKNIITKYFYKKNIYQKFVEIGYMIVNKKILIDNYDNQNSSINKLIDILSKKKRANYYINDTGYLSISDQKRLKVTNNYLKKKILLVDRDGVLNKKNPYHYYVRNLMELKINKSFIKKFKKFLQNKEIFCITNQAGISTKDVTKKNLGIINNQIKNYYKKYNINIKDFFVSTHHFKSNSFFRKPRHGLFLRAAKKNKFILDRSLYIGDDIRDIEAAYNAKTKCIYIGNIKLSKNLKNRYKFTLIKSNMINKFYE